jgi:hypothetical protein
VANRRTQATLDDADERPSSIVRQHDGPAAAIEVPSLHLAIVNGGKHGRVNDQGAKFLHEIQR